MYKTWLSLSLFSLFFYSFLSYIFLDFLIWPKLYRNTCMYFDDWRCLDVNEGFGRTMIPWKKKKDKIWLTFYKYSNALLFFLFAIIRSYTINIHNRNDRKQQRQLQCKQHSTTTTCLSRRSHYRSNVLSTTTSTNRVCATTTYLPSTCQYRSTIHAVLCST